MARPAFSTARPCDAPLEACSHGVMLWLYREAPLTRAVALAIDAHFRQTTTRAAPVRPAGYYVRSMLTATIAATAPATVPEERETAETESRSDAVLAATEALESCASSDCGSAPCSRTVSRTSSARGSESLGLSCSADSDTDEAEAEAAPRSALSSSALPASASPHPLAPAAPSLVPPEARLLLLLLQQGDEDVEPAPPGEPVIAFYARQGRIAAHRRRLQERLQALLRAVQPARRVEGHEAAGAAEGRAEAWAVQRRPQLERPVSLLTAALRAADGLPRSC
ncbi:hypothetical protein HYH03_016178 [Edaphochlamys debaryana]|uniref:Uncharacterized protein n=1 Tax=Edaphochlamys debaryana TaxID=47281 RepID=A0A836BQ63_9CHLO|nr:hypothetical protein HYH03_016178 [Edaphochlamys debaryana]|eukprot:KAG2485081.1 hypothetical protein HYH03_016178 [Edaphochlamys debaryana]